VGICKDYAKSCREKMNSLWDNYYKKSQ
jgi:hypothetical protein